MAVPTVLIVPGLRDHVAQHWQTLLADRLAATMLGNGSLARGTGSQPPAVSATIVG